jgi:ADP-ribosylglycohydrolase
MINTADRVRGCFLGGAVGDALGAPIEFMTLDHIVRFYGPDGMTEYPRHSPGLFTDDTQMTLWTAEGLIRARTAHDETGEWDPVGSVNRSYLRWYLTQGERIHGDDGSFHTGWLFTEKGLWVRRAPGNSCLSALRAGGLGTATDPINDSKGCGGVMRVAPVGFVPDVDVFALGSDLAALTHGHPSGYLAAGALVEIISAIGRGESLEAAISRAMDRLVAEPSSEEVLRALEAAIRLAETGEPRVGKAEWLGAGWVAEEALAIAVYCALVAEDFRSGVVRAVNHSGDSDSTGSITGQILGAMYGPAAIPNSWLEPLELRGVVERLAQDFARTFVDGFSPERVAYPAG